MEIVHVYTKKRSEFGRQPLFTDRPAELNVELEPNDSLRKDFIDKNPVDMAIQYAPEMSEHEVHVYHILYLYLRLNGFCVGKYRAV